MSDRATRPLNQEAAKAADEDVYAKHADDPRPNAWYDAGGHRKPLDASDPDQADARAEWMDSYKANGGETEKKPASSDPAGEAILPCDRRALVNPVIAGDPVTLDDSHDTIDDLVKASEETAAEPAHDDGADAEAEPTSETAGADEGSLPE